MKVGGVKGEGRAEDFPAMTIQCCYCRRWQSSQGTWTVDRDVHSADAVVPSGGSPDGSGGSPELPRVSHGVCPECKAVMMARYGLTPTKEAA